MSSSCTVSPALGSSLAAPGAIGGTTPAAGTFTTLQANGAASHLAGVKLQGSTPAAAADQVSYGIVDINDVTTAAEETVYEGGGKWQRRVCSTSATVKTMKYAQTVADDATVALPAPTNLGWVIVTSYDEQLTVAVKADGTCTKVQGSTNTDVLDTDAKLDVYSNAGVPTVKNRLGGSRFLLITYELA